MKNKNIVILLLLSLCFVTINVLAQGDGPKSNLLSPKVVWAINPIDTRVNLETGAFNTEKGSSEILTVWTDSDFDASQKHLLNAHGLAQYGIVLKIV